MILVEKHIIKNNHKYYKEIDKLSFLSKNLYNYANYIVRNEFIKTSKEKQLGLVDHGTYFNYYYINKLLIQNNQIDYISLPRKVSNQILINLDNNWKSFFRTIKDYVKTPNKYKGKPSLPNYKDKQKGRNILIYELGAISKVSLKNNIIKLSRTNIEIPFINLQKENIKFKNNIKLKQCRIIPKNNYYIIEIVYKKKEKDLKLNKNNIISIDLGINNLMTLTSNKKGLNPVIVNGRPLKSINQYYNKKLSLFKSELPFNKFKKQLSTSKKINNLILKRNNKIENYLHKTSKYVINYCINNDIGTIVIGHNKSFKFSVNIGKANNQNFVQIPLSKLISYIEYKSKFIGNNVIMREESYTSKASFLDYDEIPTYNNKENNNDLKNNYNFSGKRIKRGLYLSKNGILINADVNGSYNIMRKEFPNIFSDGIEGVAVNPIRVKI